MAHRHFSFSLISATDLPDVRNFGRMKVYAHVSLRNATTIHQTSVDEINGTSPKWNTIFKYLLPQSTLEEDQGHSILDVKLYCHRTLGDDKYIGQVNINVKRLFEGGLSNPLTMAVKVEPDHKSEQGTIEFSYNFGNLESNVIVEGRKCEKSFGDAVAQGTVVALIVEGVKQVVLAALGS